MKKLVYYRKDNEGTSDTSRNRVEARLYIVKRVYNDKDKADSSAVPLPVEHIIEDYYRVQLPNKRIVLQLEGLVARAWAPVKVQRGEVEVCGYEEIRYQTLRDGLLIDPISFSDAAIVDLVPYRRRGSELDYHLPKRKGDFYVGPNYSVGAGRYPTIISHVSGYEGRGAERRGIRTSKDGVALLPPGAYSERNKVGIAVRGGALSYNALLDSKLASYDVVYQDDNTVKVNATDNQLVPFGVLNVEDATRLRTVISSLRDLKNDVDDGADPRWLLGCAVLGRAPVLNMYFKGKPEGVYAKEVSNT